MEKSKLAEPPYLQIAFDAPDINAVKRVISAIPKSSNIILEAGTPLIKKYGIGVIGKIKNADQFVIADLKTLDVGGLEARLAADAGADGAVVSGLAAYETISEFISEAHRSEMYAVVDMMNVKEKAKLIGSLVELPDIVILHRGIDTEKSDAAHSFDVLSKVKKEFGDRLLIAIAGGIRMDSAKKAIENGADIVVVGRCITEASNVKKTVDEFLKILR